LVTGSSKTLVIWLLLWLVGFGSACNVRAAGDGPGLLEQSKQVLTGKTGDEALWIAEKTGQYLPLDLEFVDDRGRTVRLAEIIDRPTIVLPIYFYCPNICSRNLANLAIALNSLSARPGKDYRAIALSFNEVENHREAAAAKKNYLKILADDFPAEEWRFLTGGKEAIQAATEALGFRFQKIDDQTFIHPAALMVVAADGKIIRYVYGSFLAGDIDLALAAAARGLPTLSVKRFLDFCFNYDPNANKLVFQTVKIIVLVVFAAGLVFIFLYFKRKGRKAGADPER
jgi:protein SCO1/2